MVALDRRNPSSRKLRRDRHVQVFRDPRRETLALVVSDPCQIPLLLSLGEASERGEVQRLTPVIAYFPPEPQALLRKPDTSSRSSRNSTPARASTAKASPQRSASRR